MVRIVVAGLIYVCWPTGLGKTTCMMELGHILCLQSLSSKAVGPVGVKLVLANADLVPTYNQLFEEKKSKADSRVKVEWLSMVDFREQLLENSAQLANDCIIVDEGDTLLVEEMYQRLKQHHPKNLVLLSAVPEDKLSGKQRLCFHVKNKPGKYLDARDVFPTERQLGVD